jgi:3-deoxy-7-phosphoheptulonate synthase
LNPLDDTRIVEVMPLIPPEILMEDIPLTDVAFATTLTARREASAIIHGDDDRLLVIVGPCSVHDPNAALDYGKIVSFVLRC